MSYLLNLYARLTSEDRGATAVEYGIMVALIAIVIILAVTAIGGNLQQTFNDPDLERQVGLLWLGEEYAQLPDNFCNWQRSGTSESCTSEDLNRSAFVTWIDCRL